MTLIEFDGLRHLRVKHGTEWIMACEVFGTRTGKRTYFPTGDAHQIEGPCPTCFDCVETQDDVLRTWYDFPVTNQLQA